jgi:carbamoyltransferase
MNILGISCYYHDAAAALLQGGKLIAAAEEERFTRKKHDFGFPENAIHFCCNFAGIEFEDLDYVVFYEKPFVKFERILMTSFQTFPRSWKVFREAMITWLLDKLWIKGQIKERLGIEEKKILFCEHHMAHAASAFLCSPFDEAAILTVDGVGEWTTAAQGLGRGTEIKLDQEIKFPHSLGLLYSAFTAFLGFEVNEGEYKVMGMAPYGEPRYLERIFDKLVRVAPDGSFHLNMDYFSYHYSPEKTFNSKFTELFGEPRDPKSPFFTRTSGYPIYFGEKPSNYQELSKENEYYADVAASIQRATEEIILKMANHLYKETGLKKLCIAGGVGLNSVANGKILMETPFDDLFVQPAAGDSGGALGAALWVWHCLMGKPRGFTMEHAFWGQDYGNGDIEAFLKQHNIRYELPHKTSQLLDSVLDDILSGKIVGWYQGRFEWGPRALGNRSILADPRKAEVKDIVNIKIKFREPFRPFAPVVLEESTQEFFDIPQIERHYPARYMLLVLPIREEKQEAIAAINHMGTGRLQTIRREWNERYYDLVDLFGQATGVPVLLNTSFNLRGEPIVTSPQDAYRTFSNSGIDTLVLGDYLVRKG